jgi:hypothetical protein
MINFNTTIRRSGGDEDDFIPAEVSYEMRDLGVMGRRNENVRPVIRVVRFKGGRLDSLTDEQVEELEREAARHNAGVIDREESFYSSR